MNNYMNLIGKRARKASQYKINTKVKNSVLTSYAKMLDENKDLIIKEKNEPMKGLIAYLLKWNYEHFVYNRRQSLKNLYENCHVSTEYVLNG